MDGATRCQSAGKTRILNALILDNERELARLAWFDKMALNS